MTATVAPRHPKASNGRPTAGRWPPAAASSRRSRPGDGRTSKRSSRRRPAGGAVADAPPPRGFIDRFLGARPAPHRRDQALLALRRPDRRRPARTSSPGLGPTRPAGRRRSRSCASRTGSAARSRTCAPSARRSRSRCSPRSSSSTTASSSMLRAAGADARPPAGGPAPGEARLRALVERALAPRPRAARRGARRARAPARARDGRAAHRHQQPRPADARRRPGPGRRGSRALVPDDRLVIAESGVRDAGDDRALAGAGLRWRARRRGAHALARPGRRGPGVRGRRCGAGRSRPTSPAGRS